MSRLRPLYGVLGVFLFVVGCAGTARKPTLDQALETGVVALDVSYGLAVELCDAQERAIIQRPPSTIEADREDLAHVREICDQIFVVFDETRRLKLLIEQLRQL